MSPKITEPLQVETLYLLLLPVTKDVEIRIGDTNVSPIYFSVDFCRVAKNPTNTLIFIPAHRSKLPGTSTQEAGSSAKSKLFQPCWADVY